MTVHEQECIGKMIVKMVLYTTERKWGNVIVRKGREEVRQEGRRGESRGGIYVLTVVAILTRVTRGDYWELAFLLAQDDEGDRLTYGKECSNEKRAMPSERRLASQCSWAERTSCNESSRAIKDKSNNRQGYIVPNLCLWEEAQRWKDVVYTVKITSGFWAWGISFKKKNRRLLFYSIQWITTLARQKSNW